MLRILIRPLLLVALLAVGFALHQHLDLSAAQVIETTRAFVMSQGAFGPPVFIGICILGMLLHAPEIIFIAAGGVLFGRIGGFIYGWIAATIGASCTFFLARYFLRDAMRQSFLRSDRLRALDEKLARHGFLTVLGLRLVLFLAPPVNWAIGATRVRYAHYLAGSALGVIPGIAVTVFFADRIATIHSWTQLVTPEVAIPALLIVAFMITSAVVAHRMLGARGRAAASPRH